MTAAELLNSLAESLGIDLCKQFVIPEVVSLAEDPVFRVRKSIALNFHNICKNEVMFLNNLSDMDQSEMLPYYFNENSCMLKQGKSFLNLRIFVPFFRFLEHQFLLCEEHFKYQQTFILTSHSSYTERSLPG